LAFRRPGGGFGARARLRPFLESICGTENPRASGAGGRSADRVRASK
jgi:hypothetical protein